jgi:predicted nucleic acid-binding protein
MPAAPAKSGRTTGRTTSRTTARTTDRTTAREPAPPPYRAEAPAAAPHRAFVVDASVSAAWLLPDEADEYTAAALAATVTAEVWVPMLWTLEMANLLSSAQRRRRITADKRAELADAAAALRIKICREPLSLLALDALAAAQGLSAYDACYLELALRRRLPLATRDAALVAAMQRTGVALAAPAGV